jgi:hypothetical protein
MAAGAVGHGARSGAAEEGISRTEFILRSCQERARDVLLERTLFFLTPAQTTALLADLENSGDAARDQAALSDCSPCRSPGMGPPEPLGMQHQPGDFDCGNAAINRWLQQRALADERQGVSRTMGLCPGEGNNVIACACLSAGAIVLAHVPGALRRNRPDPLSVVVLGLIGARALLVHAIDEQAAAFYRSLEFRPSPLAAQRLDVDAAALRTSQLTEAPKTPRHSFHGLPQHRSDPGRGRRHHGGARRFDRVCGLRHHQLRLSCDVGAARGGELRGAAAATGSLDRQSLAARDHD